MTICVIITIIIVILIVIFITIIIVFTIAPENIIVIVFFLLQSVPTFGEGSEVTNVDIGFDILEGQKVANFFWRGGPLPPRDPLSARPPSTALHKFAFFFPPLPPPFSHDSLRTPKRAHLRVSALQTPPKFHEKTPERERESAKMVAGEWKKARCFGPPPFGPHSSFFNFMSFWIKMYTRCGPPALGPFRLKTWTLPFRSKWAPWEVWGIEISMREPFSWFEP